MIRDYYAHGEVKKCIDRSRVFAYFVLELHSGRTARSTPVHHRVRLKRSISFFHSSRQFDPEGG